MHLLSTGNPKTLKGEKVGYLTFILHLAPAKLSGFQVCPKSTPGCRASCLNTAGRGGIFKQGETTNIIQKARIRKTRLFFEYRRLFMDYLIADITLGIKQAKKKGLIPVFRLNGTSDICFEKIRVGDKRNIFECFPGIQFYDYTKISGRTIPANYHLTFSKSESNALECNKVLNYGGNIAAVFSKKWKGLPETYNGFPVVSGDESDLRFLDPVNSVIGLIAKGKARQDTSGFVI